LHSLGITKFLSKPLFPSDIVDCISECLCIENQQSVITAEVDDFSGFNVLLAEDIEINQEIAVAVLEGMGIDVDVAENGAAAVEAYRDKPYDLIFMDIRMPVMDGLQAAKEIRMMESESGTGAHIPIIAMTANVMQEDQRISEEAGMDGHISKPLDIGEITKTLRTVFADLSKTSE
jgi:CheY-like chemotaxis protein